MPPDRCGRYRFSVPVAAECAELFPLPEEARAWEKVRYKSGDVNYNTGHLLYNIGHMFYKTAHPRYKSSDMCYKIGDMFYKSVDMPRIPLIIAPYATITAPRVKLHPIEEKLTESRTEAYRVNADTRASLWWSKLYQKRRAFWLLALRGSRARDVSTLNKQQRAVMRSAPSA